MRIAAFAIILALVGIAASAPALAHHGRAHVSVGVGVGFGFGPYWGPYWGPGWWAYPPPYYYYPGPVVAAPPVTYIEQGSAPASAPADASGNWWYYCESAHGYYPYVKECPAGWQRVPPTPPTAR